MSSYLTNDPWASTDDLFNHVYPELAELLQESFNYTPQPSATELAAERFAKNYSKLTNDDKLRVDDYHMDWLRQLGLLAPHERIPQGLAFDLYPEVFSMQAFEISCNEFLTSLLPRLSTEINDGTAASVWQTTAYIDFMKECRTLTGNQLFPVKKERLPLFQQLSQRFMLTSSMKLNFMDLGSKAVEEKWGYDILDLLNIKFLSLISASVYPSLLTMTSGYQVAVLQTRKHFNYLTQQANL